MDRTDELTEYDFEYEFLLEEAFRKRVAETASQTKVNTGDGKIEREFSMDEEEYQHIVELAEAGEYVDFEIPADAPEGKRASDRALGIEEKETSVDAVPIDLAELFGGGHGG